jgi:hypothetical protein
VCRFPFIVCSLSWLPRLSIPLAQFGEVRSAAWNASTASSWRTRAAPS